MRARIYACAYLMDFDFLIDGKFIPLHGMNGVSKFQ